MTLCILTNVPKRSYISHYEILNPKCIKQLNEKKNLIDHPVYTVMC